MGHGLIEKQVPRRRADDVQHPAIVDSLVDKTLDETFARPLRRHPDAIEVDPAHSCYHSVRPVVFLLFPAPGFAYSMSSASSAVA